MARRKNNVYRYLTATAVSQEDIDIVDQLLDLRLASERAQAEADDLREEFSAAVRRVHSEGKTLREIADALGISHQRVHQIVGGQNVLQCSFCDRLQTEVPKLIAGPGVYICNTCVDDAFRVTHDQVKRSGSLRTLGDQLAEVASCSFCKKKARKVRALAAGSGIQICNECVALCREIIGEES